MGEDQVTLHIDGHDTGLAVVPGTVGDTGIDINRPRALGFPVRMFTVLFALGRLPGWISRWKETTDDPNTRIGRPRRVCTGEALRDYVPIADR
jgi:hypothetical protein